MVRHNPNGARQQLRPGRSQWRPPCGRWSSRTSTRTCRRPCGQPEIKHSRSRGMQYILRRSCHSESRSDVLLLKTVLVLQTRDPTLEISKVYTWGKLLISGKIDLVGKIHKLISDRSQTEIRPLECICKFSRTCCSAVPSAMIFACVLGRWMRCEIDVPNPFQEGNNLVAC